MSRAGICQIICVVLLVIFISLTLSQEKVITKTVGEITEAVSAAVGTENLQSFDETRFEDEFSLSCDGFEEFIYYGSEDIMNPEELIVIKIKDGVDPSSVESAIKKRADDKYNTFKDYDPVAADLLQNTVIRREKNVILYIVDENASAGLEAFLDITE